MTKEKLIKAYNEYKVKSEKRAERAMNLEPWSGRARRTTINANRSNVCEKRDEFLKEIKLIDKDFIW